MNVAHVANRDGRGIKVLVTIAVLFALAACAEEVNPGPLAPARLPADASQAAAEGSNNSVKSADLQPMTSQSQMPGAVVAMRTLRKAPADSIAKWRQSLDKLAKVSRRKEAAVALSRILLDAISASSDAEYRRRIAQLPVVITDSAGFDAAGRAGFYRNYSVYGKTRMSVFRPTMGQGQPNPEQSVSLEGDETEPGVTHDEIAMPAAVTWCVDDLPEGYWEGECATQAEIDDANSAMSALEAEMDGVEGDVAHAEYCHEHPEDYQTCADQEENFSLATAPEWLEDGAEESMVPQWSGSCTSDELDANFMLSRSAAESCINEATQAGIAAVAWWGSKVASRAVLGLATTSNAVGWAIFGSMTAGWALAAAAGSYIQCLQE